MSTVPTVPKQRRQYTWSYGIITIPSRMDKELPRTIASLLNAGFGTPKLFVDGISHKEAMKYESHFGLPVTSHLHPMRPFGNWILGLWELWIYNPTADYYAMFQDDTIACKNLREYIEQNPFPQQSYANLITVPANERKILGDQAGSERVIGWHESNQMGLGAQALIFSRTAVMHLLSSRVMVEKPWLVGHKAWKNIDGSIVIAMNNAGYKEYVHYPSLVQHVGEKSTIGNDDLPCSDCFWSKDYDAIHLLRR